ncbi:MAG TPA: PAS domain S-box protein, partial [Acidobacteriota bacterium]|nr:PAS domain S-box protein [Acidobacteriota bacterium]
VAQGKMEDEGWRVKKDGTRYWANEVITPLFDDNGTLVGFSKVLRDLSERHTQEQKIQEQKLILAGIIDATMDGVITIDDTHRIIVFNRASEAMFRCSAAEALGQPLDTFIPERFRTSHDQLVRNFADSGTCSQKMAVPRIIYGLRADGEEFPLEAVVSQTAVNGRKQLTVIVRDITQRLQSENAITAQLALQEQLAKLAEVFPGALFSFCQKSDGAFAMPYISPSVEEVFGLTADLIREDATPIFQGIHPDDVALVRQSIAESARLMTLWHDAFRFQHPDKGELWLEAWSAPVHELDGGILWYGVVIDATSQKQIKAELIENQRYLKQLIESLPQIVWTTNNQGQCTYVSPQWYDYTGIQPITPLPETWSHLVDPEDSERNAGPFQEALHIGQMFDAEYRLRRADGAYRWFKVRAVPFRDQSGKIVKWIGTSTDIDDQ